MSSSQAFRLEDLDNPVISIGFQVVSGAISPQDAVAVVRSSRVLSSHDDRALGDLLDAVGRWATDANGTNPGIGWIYHLLRLECAKERLTAIGRLRRAEPRPEADVRMAGWISRTASYAVILGMESVLASDLQMAFDCLVEAEMFARALPDLDRPRFLDMAAALIGQIEVARTAGQDALAQRAEQRLAEVAQAPAFRDRAQDTIRSLAETYRDLWATRQELANGQPSAHAGPTDGAGNPVSTTVFYYYQALARAAQEVEAGTTTADAAVARLGASSALDILSPEVLRFVAGLITALPPARSRTVARLHRNVCGALTGPGAGYATAVARCALGTALLRVRSPQPTPEQRVWFREAVDELSGCLPALDAEGDEPRAAWAVMRLGIAHRGLGEIPQAVETDLEAVRRWESLPTSPVQRTELASARGNLGEALELSGRLDEGLDAYLRAYDEFVALGDLQLARHALNDVWSLATDMGRADEAAAATSRMLDLVQRAADLVGTARSCVRIAATALVYGQHMYAADALDRAEKLALQVPDEPGARDDRWWQLFGDISLYQCVSLMGLGCSDSTGLLPAIRALAERARVVAVRTGSDEALVQALVLAGWAELQAGKRGYAEERARQLQLVPVSERLQPDVDSLLAAVYAAQPDLVAHNLERAVQGYAIVGRVDKEAVALVRLGSAYEQMGDDDHARQAYERADGLLEQLRGQLVFDASRIGLRANFEDLYVRLVWLNMRGRSAQDAERVWHWIERAKSRTLVELMGLGPLSAGPAASDPLIAPLLEREGQLLATLRRVRVAPEPGSLPGDGADLDALRRSHDAADAFAEVRSLWNELEPRLPEYVALRTARVADWRSVQNRLRSDTRGRPAGT